MQYPRNDSGSEMCVFAVVGACFCCCVCVFVLWWWVFVLWWWVFVLWWVCVFVVVCVCVCVCAVVGVCVVLRELNKFAFYVASESVYT
jgi:hypothetical protein